MTPSVLYFLRMLIARGSNFRNNGLIHKAAVTADIDNLTLSQEARLR